MVMCLKAYSQTLFVHSCGFYPVDKCSQEVPLPLTPSEACTSPSRRGHVWTLLNNKEKKKRLKRRR